MGQILAMLHQFKPKLGNLIPSQHEISTTQSSEMLSGKIWTSKNQNIQKPPIQLLKMIEIASHLRNQPKTATCPVVFLLLRMEAEAGGSSRAFGDLSGFAASQKVPSFLLNQWYIYIWFIYDLYMIYIYDIYIYMIYIDLSWLCMDLYSPISNGL